LSGDGREKTGNTPFGTTDNPPRAAAAHADPVEMIVPLAVPLLGDPGPAA
jgi:hypothetical protein